MIARSIAVGALVLAGCYDLPHPVCGFACASHKTVCPDDYTCNQNDNRCHLNGYTDVGCDAVPDIPDDAPNTDSDPPQVVSVQPTSFAEPTTTTIRVVFSERVLDVTSDSFFVTDDLTGQVFPTVITNTTPTMWGLDQNQAFAIGRTYTVQLTADITDVAGNALLPFSYRFGIMPDLPPSVNFRQPSPNLTGVPVDTLVSVRMSEAVMTLSGKFRLALLGFSGPEVETTIDDTGATDRATLDPVEQLQPFTGYTVVVDGTVTDLTGNIVGSDTTWQFSTGADTVVPQVRETTPKAASVAPVNSSIIILFDEPVNAIGTFAVSSGGTPILGALSPSNGGRTWTFTPSALPANAAISVVITGATDFSGNARDFAYNFMTAP